MNSKWRFLDLKNELFCALWRSSQSFAGVFVGNPLRPGFSEGFVLASWLKRLVRL